MKHSPDDVNNSEDEAHGRIPRAGDENIAVLLTSYIFLEDSLQNVRIATLPR